MDIEFVLDALLLYGLEPQKRSNFMNGRVSHSRWKSIFANGFRTTLPCLCFFIFIHTNNGKYTNTFYAARKTVVRSESAAGVCQTISIYLMKSATNWQQNYSRFSSSSYNHSLTQIELMIFTRLKLYTEMNREKRMDSPPHSVEGENTFSNEVCLFCSLYDFLWLIWLRATQKPSCFDFFQQHFRLFPALMPFRMKAEWVVFMSFCN